MYASDIHVSRFYWVHPVYFLCCCQMEKVLHINIVICITIFGLILNISLFFSNISNLSVHFYIEIHFIVLKNKSTLSTEAIIIRMSVLFSLFFLQCEVYISFSAKITAFFLIDVSFNFSLLHFLTGHHQFLDWKQNKTKQACLYLHVWMKNEQVNPSSTCWSKPAVLNWWQL